MEHFLKSAVFILYDDIIMKANTKKMLPDTFYHIYNRGNNKQPIFQTPNDYTSFLEKYKEYCSSTVDTYAYCLMKNHFHLLIKTKSVLELTASISQQQYFQASELICKPFNSFFKSYALSFNQRYKRSGALFEESFRRKPIDSDSYLTQVILYIHANPQAHGICNDFRVYPYSSFSAINSSKPTAIIREEVINWFGNIEVFTSVHNGLVVSINENEVERIKVLNFKYIQTNNTKLIV